MLSFLLNALPGPSFLWRWGAIALALISAATFGAVKMHQHDELVFDAFKTKVKEAGDKQNALTQQTTQAHKQLQELSDAEAKTRTAERDLALSRLHVLALTSGRIVPPKPPGADGNNRICFARDELDRQLGATLARAAQRLSGIAEEGQRSADVAALCRDWAKKL